MPAGQNFNQSQDWAPQVFNVRKTDESAKPQGAVTEAQANKVRQAGGVLLVSKKQTSGNQTHAGPGARAKALDDDHDNMKIKTISHDVKVEICRGRQAKGWTQVQLAQAINERASVVTDYEKGTAVPSESVLVRMEKALGIHLRGALAGQPLATANAAKK